ncbi:exodeoxyribonuclease VII small subunit [Candidatus Xianfuyuplasma coldseepsis]|uniref:Exodeoxyribonuclease 7 small subunit n=1 Tax=Candidatus Xianfuyuplasma coldseepsis TaxID=2782163 RepID=A0A7L7KTV3_9MOLU|nr:exodeoxyribonuclease VII small subunit [Xianfuyuplasma coldseepsis]QMS85686.1 exodeoxyribonuclease VII small subunit [Xianfuyuplasma coldseepsis]
MSEKSFEQALVELEQLVKELENGDIELNEAVKKYNEGMKLSAHCHELLQEAEEVIVKLMKDDKLEDFTE